VTDKLHLLINKHHRLCSLHVAVIRPTTAGFVLI